MMLALCLLIAAITVQDSSKPIPKDSVEVEARGCLKGRVLTVTAMDEETSADVVGRRFRVSGSRDVLDLVKEHHGHQVAVVGIVRKSALGDLGSGMKIGGARIVIGAGRGDPSRTNQRPAAPVPVIELTVVRHLADRCSS